MARHRWSPPVRVEVPWSGAGGNLYTCLNCGTTRQSEPYGAFFRTVFTAPDGWRTAGWTPPCTGLASSPQE
jgi:hypothetical protein